MKFNAIPGYRKTLAAELTVSVLLTAISFIFGVAAGICSAVCCTALCIVNALAAKKRYGEISALSDELDRILHGSEKLELERYGEGELAVLQSEIYKMTVRLREQADAMKREKIYLADSLADISHQIRTPLTSINLIVDFLAEEGLPQSRREELVKELYGLLGNIEWLVTTLLKISRLDAGTVRFDSEPVNAAGLVQCAYENVAVTMDLHNIEFEVKCGGDEIFTGDRRWVCEALTNVLKNCTEHTPDGGKIAVSLRETPVFTEITVSDSGAGFTDEELPRIFERFYRGGDEKETSKTGSTGFGIGLALARKIITSQNGTITAANGANGGALFTVKFYKCTV